MLSYLSKNTTDVQKAKDSLVFAAIFVQPTLFYLVYVRVKFSCNVILQFLPLFSSFTATLSHKPHVTCSLAHFYCCHVNMRCILLFILLPLDSIMESKHTCKSDNDAKRSCKAVTPDKKIKIPNKLYDTISL
jgi:hypothetical protein